MPQLFMFMNYVDNALANAKGRYIEDEIYRSINQLPNEFDKRFPPKEIIVGTPSQPVRSDSSDAGEKRLSLLNLKSAVCHDTEVLSCYAIEATIIQHSWLFFVSS